MGLVNPRSTSWSVLLVFVASTVLPGCLDETQDGAEPLPDVPLSGKDALLATLASLPQVQGYDRVKGTNWWESFVTTYDLRQWGTPKNLAAANYLQSELQAAGFQAETLKFQSAAAGTALPGDFLVVRGLKPGTTNPGHRLILISHFDTVPMTAQGAYDDGSGVAVEMEICKLLAKVPTNKTIECVFFDAEERGLVASGLYAQDYARGGKDYVYDQAFGYDMTGINWPGHATWKLWAMVGTQHADLLEYTAAHQEFMNTTLFDFLGRKLNVTASGVEVIPVHDRNSDEQNFKRIGVPVIRFAGGRRAADYPMYHQPGDVTLYVYQYSCNCQDLLRGKDAFSKGFEMVVLVSYYTILGWDQYDPKQPPL